MRINYPETWRYLQAQRARHPREQAMEEDTDLDELAKPDSSAANPRPGHAVEAARPPAREETREEYLQRQVEAIMHKNVSSRRGAGGQIFSIGGGGDGGVAYQVV